MARTSKDRPPQDPDDSGSALTIDDPGQSGATLDEVSASESSTDSIPKLQDAPPAAASSSEQRVFPDWERFQILDFLGAGGMGSVFKARDPRLQRLVAIKFMRVERLTGTELRQRQRFLREAQAQARLDHPHICKIYEVGEISSQPYIVMQYIDGHPLSFALQPPESAPLQAMSREEKVRVICQVAEALHTAHRLGLIHRDVKPGNIMIERLADGQLWPYVMDFGLAREVTEGPSSTMSRNSAIEGTPAFMSPEQARGEVRRLDRRTDVYGLGATLYAALLGRPPFEGPQMEVLLSVLLHEPMPPRLLDSSLPRDLETIICKCLEKEQERRYDSARALADDLHRFLDGEAVAAQPPSTLYRLSKSVRKNRLLWATVGPAILLCLILGGLVLRARLVAQEQAVLAEQLGQDVKEMELLMRYAYALPLHDIGREQAVIRERMSRLRERRQGTSGRESAAVHYALGRGHLVLREYEAARGELEAAWRAGYRTAAASYALGLALGELYRAELDDVRRLGDKRFMAARLARLSAEQLEPALGYLEGARRARIAADSPAYLEGLLAYHRRDLDHALQQAFAAQKEAPWLVEPLKLAGDTYRERAIDEIGRGDYKLARSSILAAAEHHHAATEIARSDAELHEAEALDYVRLLEVDDATGSTTAEPFERTRAACERAITANPRRASAHAQKAWAHWRWGIGQLQRGQDPTQTLREAQGAAEKALQLDPQNHSSYYSIGVSNYVMGSYTRERDAEQSLQYTLRAIEAYRKATEIVPNLAWYLSDLGAAYTLLIEQQAQRGHASTETLQKATAALLESAALDKEYGAPLGNLTALYIIYAQNLIANGANPTSYLDMALQYGKDGLKVNHNDFEIINSLIGVYLAKANYARLVGGDLKWAMTEAQTLLDRSLQINSNNVQVHHLAAELSIVRAMSALERSATKELEATIAQGLSAISAAAQLSDKEPRTHLLSGRLQLLAARAFLQAAGTQPGAQKWLAAAEFSAAQALSLSPHNPEAHELAAQVKWRALEAALRGAVGRAAMARNTAQLEAGLLHCKDALRIHPRHAQALATSAALEILGARLSRGEEARLRVARAQKALDEALRINSLLSREHAALLREVRERTGGATAPAKGAR